MVDEPSPGVGRIRAASRRPSKPSRTASKQSADGTHTQLVDHLKQTGELLGGFWKLLDVWPPSKQSMARPEQGRSPECSIADDSREAFLVERVAITKKSKRKRKPLQ
eukprot:5452347-Karenia_brevis.AAC.1